MDPLHVHEFGPADGPVLLAVHGITGHGKRWQALAGRHLPGVRVIAPDLRGHGRSPACPPWNFEAHADDLAAVLRARGAGPATVVGHSFGGAVAIHLAARCPELVRALVLLDPALGLPGELLLPIAESMLTDADYTDAAEARSDKIHHGWSDVAPELLDAELAEHLMPTARGRVSWRMNVPAIIGCWGELARPIALPPADLPTVLVQAMAVRPPLVTAEFRAALAARLGTNLAIHEFECDHMVAQARPAAVAALLRPLLA